MHQANIAAADSIVVANLRFMVGDWDTDTEAVVVEKKEDKS